MCEYFKLFTKISSWRSEAYNTRIISRFGFGWNAFNHCGYILFNLQVDIFKTHTVDY